MLPAWTDTLLTVSREPGNPPMRLANNSRPAAMASARSAGQFSGQVDGTTTAARAQLLLERRASKVAQEGDRCHQLARQGHEAPLLGTGPGDPHLERGPATAPDQQVAPFSSDSLAA